jgi:hypothetical protein
VLLEGRGGTKKYLMRYQYSGERNYREYQRANHEDIGDTKVVLVSLVDRRNCGADPSAFTGKNFEPSALHSSVEALRAPLANQLAA